MWIKYICLENFKNIKTGLKANRLEIDFSNRENIICLITGPNGMGKTTLLSCLTPFATFGNLDIRDTSQIILPKKPGYKKIIIMNGEDEIAIEHFYSVNKDSHSVKSYFKLNDTELNPNGNVSSFKEIVSEILGIDTDYLKLIRLGDNVMNLIRLKSTERKTFMSKMLPSVDNYLKYYKKLSTDVRELNVVISHIIDKINKLKISDESEQEQKIKEIEDGIEYYEKEIEKISEEIHKCSFHIVELKLPPNSVNKKRELKRKLDKYESILTNMETDIEKIDLSLLEKKLDEKKKKLLLLENDIMHLTNEWNRTINDTDSITSEIVEINDQIDRKLSKSNISSLQEYMQKMLEKDRVSKYVGLPFIVHFTLDELNDFIVKIKNIQRELEITYGFGKSPINEVIDMMEKDINIGDFVTAHLLALENEQNKRNKTYLDTLIDKYERVNYSCETKECPYYKLYQDIMKVKEVTAVEKTTKTSEYYEIVNIVHENIKTILSQIEECSEFIKRLPDEYQKMFTKKKIFKQIRNCAYIYDDEKINELLTMMTEYDNYVKLQKEIEETRHKIEEMKQNTNLDYLVKTKKKIEEKKKKLDEIKEDLIYKVEKAREEKQELEKDIEVIEDTIESVRNYEDVKIELEELKIKIASYIDYKSKEEKLTTEREKLIQKKTYLLGEKSEKEHSLIEYKKLQKELAKCKEMYDHYVLLRSANSAKEGIPLLHIEMYLKDTKDLANELLDIVYDGEIQIDKFDISGTDFKIPYTKNGMHIADISSASQGEESFLNMAISFALSIQNLTEYNIPLLDEVDATFDQEKREKAIDIIERQNEIIQSEQTFIISHNNMYDQYPVDILDFANFSSSKFNVHLS